MPLALIIFILIIGGAIGVALVWVIESCISMGWKAVIIFNFVLMICAVGWLLLTLGFFNHTGNIPVTGVR